MGWINEKKNTKLLIWCVGVQWGNLLWETFQRTGTELRLLTADCWAEDRQDDGVPGFGLPADELLTDDLPAGG